MARITYSGFVTDIRGSIGGTTFQRNASGYTVKNKPNIVRLQSDLQLVQRRRFDRIVRGWLEITQAQRDSWNAFAISHPTPSKHNPSSMLTGYQYFLKFNMIYTQCILNYMPEPLVTEPTIPIITPTLKTNGTLLNLNLVPASTAIYIFGNIYLSPPMKATSGYRQDATRTVGGNGFYNTEFDYASSYIDHFGKLPEVGDRVFLEVQPFSTEAPLLYASQYFILTVGTV